MARLAAVTGGSGFLGRELLSALAADGWDLRLLLRRDPAQTAPAGHAPEVVLGDLADAAALARLCRGADVLIHVAGRIKAPDRAAFDAANVEGARRAALAARQAGVRRMVLVSSLAAREPQLSDYAASKRAGEMAAREAFGPGLSIVRPPAIYGSGDRETLVVFRAAARAPILPTFDPAARIALIHVADAARQIATAAGTPPAQPIVALSDARPEGYAWREIIEAALQALGRQGRIVRVPQSALLVAGWLGLVQRALGADPILSPGKARELAHLDWSLSSDERWNDAPRTLFGLMDGFAETIAAWRAKGALP